jgi:hypothetical protein
VAVIEADDGETHGQVLMSASDGGSGHEGIVGPFGIGGVKPVDLLPLARAQGFVRIEAGDGAHEALAT